jgi:hypothetical protein
MGNPPSTYASSVASSEYSYTKPDAERQSPPSKLSKAKQLLKDLRTPATSSQGGSPKHESSRALSPEERALKNLKTKSIQGPH